VFAISRSETKLPDQPQGRIAPRFDSRRGEKRPLTTSTRVAFGLLARRRDGSWDTVAVEGLPPQSLAVSPAGTPSLSHQTSFHLRGKPMHELACGPDTRLNARVPTTCRIPSDSGSPIVVRSNSVLIILDDRFREGFGRHLIMGPHVTASDACCPRHTRHAIITPAGRPIAAAVGLEAAGWSSHYRQAVRRWGEGSSAYPSIRLLFLGYEMTA
jgi:hypothetical protein